jgi:hypothetical protein
LPLPLVVFALDGLLPPSAQLLLPASHEASMSISLVPGKGLSRIAMEAWSPDVATGEVAVVDDAPVVFTGDGGADVGIGSTGGIADRG